MTKEEIIAEKNSELFNAYSGVLFNYQLFDKGSYQKLTYNFEGHEFVELRDKYDLLEIAGRGSSLTRAKRLVSHFAPKLAHDPYYDNHIECNALKLLEFSYKKKKNGINCLNKSKILQECCLAVGIYARRVCIMPYSPFDFDNHVVIEIYDEKLEKWVMLDPSENTYAIDENKTPLSLLQIRENFANDKFVTVINIDDKPTYLKEVKEKNISENAYLSKNLFYFIVEKESTFGESKEKLFFVPTSFSIKTRQLANLNYRIDHTPKDNKRIIKLLRKQFNELLTKEEIPANNVKALIEKPF